MLIRLHTRAWAYGALTLSVLGLEAFLGWRAEEMYAALLGSFASPVELLIVRLVIGVSVAIFGFVLATHRQYGLEAQLERIKEKEGKLDGFDARKLRKRARRNLFLAMTFVIVHDVAGAIYLILASQAGLTLATLEGNAVLAIQLSMAALGMTAMVFLPFLIGHFTLALAESLPAEQAQQYAVEGLAHLRGVKLTAVEKIAKDTRRLSAEGAWLLLERSAGNDLSQIENSLIREFQQELALLIGVRKDAPMAAAPESEETDDLEDETPERVTVKPEPTPVQTLAPVTQAPALPEGEPETPVVPAGSKIITDAHTALPSAEELSALEAALRDTEWAPVLAKLVKSGQFAELEAFSPFVRGPQRRPGQEFVKESDLPSPARVRLLLKRANVSAERLARLYESGLLETLLQRLAVEREPVTTR